MQLTVALPAFLQNHLRFDTQQAAHEPEATPLGGPLSRSRGGAPTCILAPRLVPSILIRIEALFGSSDSDVFHSLTIH